MPAHSRAGSALVVGVIAAVALAFPTQAAHAQREARSELAVAESALVHGDMDRAVDLARAYTSHHSSDWRGWFVQGEATLRRGGTDNAYRVAAIIAFNSPQSASRSGTGTAARAWSWATPTAS